MNFNRYETKMRAKEAIRQTKPKAMWVTLVYLLLTSLVSLLVGFLTPNPAIKLVQMELANGGSAPAELVRDFLLQGVAPAVGVGLFLSILVALFSTVMQYGYCGYCIKAFRREEAGFGTLFNGFGIAAKVVGSAIMVWLFTVLWSLAVIVPATIIIGLIVYLSSSGFAVFLAMLVYLAALALVMMITLRYAMVPYIIMDSPEMGVFASIHQSEALMRGHIWELFVLQLSFIGWYLLFGLIVYGTVVVGVMIAFFALGGLAGAQSIAQMGGFILMMSGMILLGFLLSLPLMMWLTSYVGVTNAGFYDRFVIHPTVESATAPEVMPPVREDLPTQAPAGTDVQAPNSEIPQAPDPVPPEIPTPEIPTLHGDAWGMNSGDKKDRADD